MCILYPTVKFRCDYSLHIFGLLLGDRDEKLNELLVCPAVLSGYRRVFLIPGATLDFLTEILVDFKS